MNKQPVKITELQTKPGAVLPEAVDAKRRSWTVGPIKTSPLVNYDKRTMEVPLDSSEDSIAIRAHEMAHPAYTPASLGIQGLKQGIPHTLINAVEDGRVNTRLRAAGVAAPKCPPDRIRDLIAASPMQAAAVCLACEGTGDEPIAAQCLQEVWGAREAEWVAEQARLITPNASPKVTLQVAKAILDHYGTPDGGGTSEGDSDEASKGNSDRADESAKGDSGHPASKDTSDKETDKDGFTDSEAGKVEARLPTTPTTDKPALPASDPAGLTSLAPPPPDYDTETPDDPHRDLRAAVDTTTEPDLMIGKLSEADLIKRALGGYLAHQAHSSFYSRHHPKNVWCPMTIHEPRLTIRIRRGSGRGHQPQYYGRAPRYPHRMASDRRIFANKRGSLTFPGTVLIDVSGSMAIEAEDIERIIAAYPAAKVATYCSDGRVGRLTTVVKNGKRLDNLRGFSSGNGIDGPALQWLTKEARPRIWICDGIVTGMGDCPGKNLFTECMQVVAHSRIIPFPTLEAFLDELGSNA